MTRQRDIYVIFPRDRFPDPQISNPVEKNCPLCGQGCWFNGDRDPKVLAGIEVMCMDCVTAQMQAWEDAGDPPDEVLVYPGHVLDEQRQTH